jgi:uncharacterized membrane protein YhhN
VFTGLRAALHRSTRSGDVSRARSLAGASYAIVAAADTLLASSGAPAARRLRWLTKPLLMPTLAARFLDATRDRDDRLRRGTPLALGFSWGGDVALLGKGQRPFLAGVGSFFAAHVCYIAALESVRPSTATRQQASSLGPRIAAAVWLAGAPVMTVAAGRKDPSLRVPVVAYATVLATMLACATRLDRSLPRDARRRLAAGSAVFVVSDAVLSVREFLLAGEHPRLEAAVMGTYTTGQWLIADGAARAAGR